MERGLSGARHGQRDGPSRCLAYWTISDHFEELGRPPSLLHGGFGLLALGNLRKPRWWALWMLEQLGEERLATSVEGDGAGDMIDAVATRAADRTVAILAWNGTVDVTKAGGEALLDRQLELTVTGLGAAPLLVRHRRLDERHSNIDAAWARIGAGRAWPDDAGWRALREEDHLADLEPPRYVRAEAGALTLSFDLPMPSVSLVELHPDETRSPD